MSLADNLPARDASLQSLLSSISTQAIATGISGAPAEQTLSVQGNNERLLMSASLTAAGTFFEVDLSTNAHPFNMMSINVYSVGTGGVIAVQGCNEPPTAANRQWNQMQWQATINTNVAGSLTGLGGGYLPMPFAYVRVVLNTSTVITGTYSVSAFFTKNMAPLRSVAAKGDPVGYAVTGSPTGVGYCARTTLPTIMSDNFAVAGMGTTEGVGIQEPFSIPQMKWAYPNATQLAAGPITTATTVTIKSAPAAGLRNYLTGLQIDNSSTTTGTLVNVRDGHGGTIIWQGYFPAGRSRDLQFVGSPLKGTAATLIEVEVVTAGAAITISAQGHVSGAMP